MKTDSRETVGQTMQLSSRERTKLGDCQGQTRNRHIGLRNKFQNHHCLNIYIVGYTRRYSNKNRENCEYIFMYHNGYIGSSSSDGG